MHHINLSGRDVPRGIMQWRKSEKVGFKKDLSWILFNQKKICNVEDQGKDEKSILIFYSELLALKKQPFFQVGSYERVETEDTAYVYKWELEGQQALVYSTFPSEPVSSSSKILFNCFEIAERPTLNNRAIFF